MNEKWNKASVVFIKKPLRSFSDLNGFFIYSSRSNFIFQ
ncbi:hypothetical protein M395_10060 [Enterococcus faecium T110]|nr:hypothetical protein M395_10060 [Enterococcus faecium T110]